SALASLENEWTTRLEGVPARLDEAMQRFHEVAKLNSDDVATVRRILTHLDSQRESLPRISMGLRLQLESSLTQAERLLVTLAEEYEATRVIADQLVSEGLLDDVFGAAFGAAAAQDGSPTDDTPSNPAAVDTSAYAAVAERSGAGTVASEADQELLKRYAESHGVLAVTLLDGDGNALHGTTDDEQDVTAWTSDTEGGYPALEALRRSAAAAHGLEHGETLAISLESPSRVVILGWTSS